MSEQPAHYPHSTTLSVLEWSQVLAARGGRTLDISQPWHGIFAPIVTPLANDAFVIGQIGQSIDGRIATPSGHSHYINGPQALDHLHRLRALVDAVVVGIGTVVADDPRLTVRRIDGPNPARVVIDPRGRIGRQAQVLADDGCRRIVIATPGAAADLPVGVERLPVAADAAGAMPPAAILEALARGGLRKILVEGGALTLSRFLAAGRLDRLHVMVGAMIIGSGPHGLSLPAITHLDGALRPRMQSWRLGEDLLIDLDFAPR
jgi:diaminohydroxyphosphoribosylaminopyrimidine deaminase/5-amino-6-(5-phosphoribosylamino)uracil reductase